MFAEALAGFFEDFGVDATVGAVTAKVILDQPDEDPALGIETLVAPAAVMTFERAAFPALKAGDAVTIGTTSYRVRTVMRIDDGELAKAELLP